MTVEPYAAGHLTVGDDQQIYWETVGDPDGTPAIFLHGGPGSGCSANMRNYFTRGRFRAVLFDQRGCGRSRPLVSDADADLTVNTTAHLVDDIERLRAHLDIDSWVVAGVSWGVNLALVYAQQHPEHVTAMVLGAVTTGTRDEINWITREMGRIFPDEWDEFVSLVPVAERDGDLAAAYARLLAHPDAHVRADAARRWCRWEDTHVRLTPGWRPQARYADESFRLIVATLVTHYWSHDCFLAPNQILDQIDRIADIPAVLIHGRHDISSPLRIAWQLSRRWPAARLEILDDAGHGGGSFVDTMATALASFSSG